MFSAQLVHQIEDHWDTIANRLIQHVHQSPELRHVRMMADSDLREAARRILQNLGDRLVALRESEFSLRYEQFGRQQCEDGLPLSETIRALQLLREETFTYIRDQGLVQTAVDLYAEEELGHQLAHFFDLLEFHVMRGYEERWHEHEKRHAHAASVK